MASKPRKRPDRGWLVEWTRIRDGKRTSRTLPTEREAWRFWRELEALHARGEAWVPRAVRGQPDAHELAERWLMECQTRNGHRTLVRKGQMIGAFLRRLDEDAGHDREPDDHGRGIYLCDLELHDELVAHHAWLGMERTGRHFHGRLPSTTGKHLAEVSRWLHWCWERGHIDRPARLQLRRATAPSRPAPTWAQMDACIAQVTGPKRRALVLMRCTGLRVGQVMRLLWSDVDLETARLRIRPELGKSEQERRGRTVPLAPVLVEAMAGWGVRDGYVVPTWRENGTREMRARDINRAWRRAKVPLDVWGKGHGYGRGRPDHAFRAGFKTGLVAAGAREAAVDFLVGHSRGVDESYVDPWAALGLAEAVALVPPIGEHANDNVRQLRVEGE